MNAIDFLIKEHDKVRKILNDISDNSHHETTKKKMFDDLTKELIRHEKMEHQIWYPHFKNKLSQTVQHLVKEEQSAEKAIKKMENIDAPDTWETKFAKFKKDVEHHATEEEKDLFPEVRKILDEAQLEKIGKEMYAFKQDYQS